MFDRYTEQARRSVFFARYEASVTGSSQIETEHLLLGILREDADLTRRLLHSSARVEALREQIGKQFPAAKSTSTSVDLPLSHTCKRALAHAAREAKQLNQREISPRHLLLGILREESSGAARILRDNGVTAAQVWLLLAEGTAPEASPLPLPLIEGLRDLNELAKKEALGPLVGRERELERIIHVLCRRTRNNPVLIGDAGVGKTAIVEGLAHRIVEGSVPGTLVDRRLIALDASALVTPRPRSPGPLAGLIGRTDTLLFVRGLFNLAAGGSAWLVLEAMHALEPLLARGDIQCIATGSPEGLRETMEKAGMLARHFEVVEVMPVSEEEGIRIIHSLKARFEQFHEVTFAEGAIETAVLASGRFLLGRHLPDRAIDLIDEAAAGVKLRRERENRAQPGQAGSASGIVTPRDIEEAVAARAGVPLEEVQRVLAQPRLLELQRIAAALAAQLPPEARAWLPFLAAYLARCSPAEAEALARAIAAARPDRGSAAS